MTEHPSDWKIFTGTRAEPNGDWRLPDPPSWRPYGKEERPGESRRQHRGDTFQAEPEVVNMVNAALYLRRPLLITGKPGTGKSSLAYAVAKELMLGEVLYWPITTRTTLKNGLYDYDAIGRLQDTKQREEEEVSEEEKTASGKVKDDSNIGKYITLGPLGTALLPAEKPRVLLVDEIDKSDIDLPNDLLTVLEDGYFKIPELARIKGKQSSVTVSTAYQANVDGLAWQLPEWPVENGVVTCTAFPLLIMTSNGERAFPPPFLRRCLRLRMQVPKGEQLERIVNAHLEEDLEQRRQAIAAQQGADEAEKWRQQALEDRNTLIKSFEAKCEQGDIAADQLLNAIFMVTRERSLVGDDKDQLIKALMKTLTSAED